MSLNRNIFRRQRFIVAAAFTSIFYLTSCRPKPAKTNNSRQKWSHLTDWNEATLLTMPPSETLYVCDGSGRAGATVTEKIKEWTAAGGIGEAFKLEQRCGGRYEIRVDVSSAEPICSQGAVAFTQPVAEGKWRITYCNAQGVTLYNTTVHEVGHLFGQCDRYGTEESNPHATRGVSCSDRGSGSDGNYQAPSVMQAASKIAPLALTPDDTAGMQALLIRSEIVGASQWRAVATPGSAGSTQPASAGSAPTTGSLPQAGNSNGGYQPPVQGAGIPSTGQAPGRPDGCRQKFEQMAQNGCSQNILCHFFQALLCGS